MIDCAECGKQIGNLASPMCVTSDELQVLCKSCFIKRENRSPRSDEQEYDPDDVHPAN